MLYVFRNSGAPQKDLITVYCAFTRPVLEYACQVWHFSLPQYLADEIDSVQSRTLRIALLNLSYAEALRTPQTLIHLTNDGKCNARNYTGTIVFKETTTEPSSETQAAQIQPTQSKNLRQVRKYRTARFQKSFIPSCLNK